MSKLEDFTLLKIIGEGGSALVFAAEHHQKIYALKSVQKEKARCSFFGITEKNILQRIKHPFIVELYSCFDTATRLCYVLEYAPGGDFMYYLNTKNWKLPFRDVRFYAAELCLAISFLHSNGIIHRDIKLRNILIGKDGHLLLTDYGSAVEESLEGRRKSFKGTRNYMAPEMHKQEEYSYEVDWWSLGVCVYFMMYGKYPLSFALGTSKESDEDTFKKSISFPDSIPATAVAFIERLLEKDPNKRLGKGGFQEISSHVLFSRINWEKLKRKELEPPFIPSLRSPRDFRYFDPDKLQEPHSLTKIPVIKNRTFENFDYINPNWKK